MFRGRCYQHVSIHCFTSYFDNIGVIRLNTILSEYTAKHDRTGIKNSQSSSTSYTCSIQFWIKELRYRSLSSALYEVVEVL